MASRQKASPTTTGVRIRDLGPHVVPLARAVASLRLPVLRPKNPVFVMWAVTEACNLACAHCDMNRPLPDELDREQRIAMAKKLAASDVWGVSLIGGEPLLVDGLFECAKILKDGGKRVFLGTSGDKLGRYVDRVLESGIDVVTVSIEGSSAEEHDAFRRRRGLFDRVVDAVDTLRARRAEGRPQLQVRITLNRHNFRSVDRIIDHWHEHADAVLLQVVQNNGLHTPRDPSCMFQPEDRPELERVMADLQRRYAFLRGRHYDLLTRYVFEPEKLHQDLGFRCLLVPATSIVLEANGKVKLCHGRPDSEIGTLLGHELGEVWQGARADDARTRMQSRDYGCMCWESSYAKNLELVEMSRLYDAFTGGAKARLGR